MFFDNESLTMVAGIMIQPKALYSWKGYEAVLAEWLQRIRETDSTDQNDTV